MEIIWSEIRLILENMRTHVTKATAKHDSIFFNLEENKFFITLLRKNKSHFGNQALHYIKGVKLMQMCIYSYQIKMNFTFNRHYEKTQDSQRRHENH